MLHQDVRRIFALLERGQRRAFFVVLGIMVLAATLQVASVAMVYPFLSVITDPGSVQSGWLGAAYDASGVGSVEAFLAVLALIVFAILVFANGSIILENWAMARFKLDASHRLSLRLLETYLLQDYSFYLQRNTSDLQRNIVAEANRICMVLVNAALSIMSKGLVAMGLLVLLLVANPLSVAVIVLVIGGGFLGIYKILRGRLSVLGDEYVVNNRKRFQIVQEAFGGIKDVKVLGRERTLIDRFRPPSKTWSTGLAKYQVYRQLPKPVIEVLAVGGLLVILAIFLLTGQPTTMIIPMMGLFVFAGYRLMPVFRDVTTAVADFRFSDALLSSLETDLKGTGLPEDPGDEPLSYEEKIALQGVSFYYPNTQEPVLRTLSLEIGKNTSVAFVGETGAGKTTVVDLILGLYAPTDGQILIDGTPLSRSNVRSWQKKIGYVPQDIFLTDDTVRRNIGFALSEGGIDDEAVVRAAKVAHIHDFIVNELPDGYDTVLGERGIRLSGGQRQRIGIARALYHDPEVLVLDEATSDIDNVTEANITAAISELSGKKTLVLIAHRLSTIRNADRIYLLGHGKILGEGTYDELVHENKAFIQLARTSDAVLQA